MVLTKRFPLCFEPKDLPRAMGDALAGIFAGEPDTLNKWLVWSQSDSTEARQSWLYLIQSGEVKDRDSYVLALWRSVDRSGSPNRSLRQKVTQAGIPWEYFQRHFFGWFLSRFHLSAARQVYTDGRLITGLHYLFALASVTAAGIILGISGVPDLNLALAAILAVVLALVIGSMLARSIPKYAYIHSLIPRLGAAVGIGFLFLASAPHLVKVVDKSTLGEMELALIALSLVVVTWLYVLVHIWRRVYPSPRLGRLSRLGFDIVALGVGYAALGLLLFAPLLFSPTLLCEPGELDCISASPARQILCAAIALILGVVLQLAWDEKPLTEPL